VPSRWRSFELHGRKEAVEETNVGLIFFRGNRNEVEVAVVSPGVEDLQCHGNAVHFSLSLKPIGLAIFQRCVFSVLWFERSYGLERFIREIIQRLILKLPAEAIGE
jgi:hypothetical protein